MALRSAGSVGATFTVVDEFSGPLAAALGQVGALQRAVGAAAASTRAFGAAADDAAPAFASLSRTLKATLPTLRAGMADAAESAAAFDGSIGGAAASVTRLKDAAAGVSTPFGKMAAAADRLDAAVASADTRMAAVADKSAAIAASSKQAASGFDGIGSWVAAASGGGVRSASGLFSREAGEEDADGRSGAGRATGDQDSAPRLSRAAERLLAIAPMAAAGPGRPSGGAEMKPQATASRSWPAGETLAFSHGLGALDLAGAWTVARQHHHERWQALARQSVIGAIAGAPEAARGARNAARLSGPTGQGINSFGLIAPARYVVHGERGATPGSLVGEMTHHGAEVRRPGNARLAQEWPRINEALKSGVATFAGARARLGALKDVGIDEATGRMTASDKAARLGLSRSLANPWADGARFAWSDRAVRLQPASRPAWEGSATRPELEKQNLAFLSGSLAGRLRSGDDRLKFAETDRQEREPAEAFLPAAARARPPAPPAGFDTLRDVLDRAPGELGYDLANRGTMAAAGGTVATASIGQTGGRSEGAAWSPQAARDGSAGATSSGLGTPPSAATIHIEAPLTVTVQGDVLGDYASLNMLLARLADEHARTITDAVTRRLRDRQNIARRSAMLDWGNADVHLGGVGCAL